MSAAPDPAAAHGGLMDQVYRHQRHLYDFTRKYYLLGRDAALDSIALKAGDRVLEIGCGTGRNLARLARRQPRAQLFGLDASEAMLRTARQKLDGVAAVVLRQGLAEKLTEETFGRSDFDHVIFSYSLSMIPDWQKALSAAAASLSQHGRLHVVDFADFEGLPGPARILLHHWLRRFHVTPRHALLALLEKEFPSSEQLLTILPGRYAFRADIAKGKVGPMLACCREGTGSR